MAIYLTLNHFGDSRTGHANITLSGSIDGVQYEALTVGSNTGPDANWQDVLGSFLVEGYFGMKAHLSQPEIQHRTLLKLIAHTHHNDSKLITTRNI